MNRTEKLIKNSGIYLVANFASKLLNVILVPIYIIYIQSKEFGNVNLLLLFSGIIGIIFSLDVIDAAYRFLLDEEADKKKVITNAILIYGIGAVLFSALYFPIVIRIQMRYGVLLGFHVLITNFQTMIQQMARGLKYNKVYATAGVLMCLIQGVSNIVLIVWFGIGGVSILIAPLIASFATILYVNCNAHIWHMFSVREIDYRMIRALIQYGMPVCVGIVFNWVISNSGTYILTWIAGTTVLSGIYAMANKFPTFLNAFTTIFNLAWQETAVEEYGNEEYISYYNKVLNKFAEGNMYAMALVMPLIAIYFSIMNANEYVDAKGIIPLLLMNNILASMQSYIISGYYVVKKTKAIYINAMIAGIITLITEVVFIFKYSINGLVASVCLGQLILLVMTYRNVQKYIAYKIDLKRLLIPLLIIILSGVCYYIGFVWIQIIGWIVVLVLIVYREKTLIFKLKERLWETKRKK